MARIHHTQIKQADKLGLSLEITGDTVIARNQADVTFAAANARDAIAGLLKLTNTTTADVMKTLKAAKPAKKSKKKAKKSRKPKLTCECGSTDVHSDGEGGYVCEACGEAVEGDEDGRSVVKKKYKVKYKPFRSTCGDDIAQKLKDHVSSKIDGRTQTDREKLVRFAKANGCWDPMYVKFNENLGMMRMNIGNRLRGKINRDKHEVVWA